MKKILIISFLAAVTAGVLFFGGCKSAQEAGEFTFTVTLSVGVTGTPEAGTHFYNAGDQVPYEYALRDNYTDLSVRLDGQEIEPSGTITVTGNHSITTGAIAEFNVLGTWTMTETYSNTRKSTVTVTFTGTRENGAVADSDGGTGAYTVDSSAVSFTLQFSNATYEYTGHFSNVDGLNGSCTRTSLITNEELTGTWTASRNTDAAAARTGQKNKGQD